LYPTGPTIESSGVSEICCCKTEKLSNLISEFEGQVGWSRIKFLNSVSARTLHEKKASSCNLQNKK